MNTERILEIIRRLTAISGTPGEEVAVREAILEYIGDRHDCEVDPLGNLIVRAKGKERAKNTVMLAAHMDEVGFMIREIEENGMLAFLTLGGIDRRTFLGKRLKVGEAEVPGVIGFKPVHLCDAKGRETIPETDDLRIDIGVSSKEDALRLVSPGDRAVFDSDFREFGNGRIKGKALDDRAGCAILLDILLQDEPLPYDLTVAFTVQEEVGCRGAMTAAYGIQPDYAIVVETTTAGDIPGVPYEKQACWQGKGAVVPMADRSTLYSRELTDLVFAVAERDGIKAHNKNLVAGGTDAGAIHTSGKGVAAVTISSPCRYIHSAVNVLKISDLLETRRLVEAVAWEFAKR